MSERPPGLGKRIRQFLQNLWDWKTPVIIGVVQILIGVVLLLAYERSDVVWLKFVGLFVSELGFACVIAALIFAGLEEWAARHHAKTAIGLLYGVKPAGDFFDKIEKHVLKQKFYRSHATVIYRFEEQDGKSIRVCQTVSYRVDNICAKDDVAVFPLMGRVDLKPLHTGDTPWDAELGLISLEVDGKPVDTALIDQRKDEQTRSLHWVRIDGIPIEYKKWIDVRFTHLVVKHIHDALVWSSFYPTSDVQFRIECAPGIDLRFAISAMHPELGTLTPEREEPNTLVIRLKEPFLCGHGIHCWWTAKTDSDPTGADARPSE